MQQKHCCLEGMKKHERMRGKMESKGEQILFHHQALKNTHSHTHTQMHTHSPADRHTHISIKSSISRVFQLHYYVATVCTVQHFVCVSVRAHCLCEVHYTRRSFPAPLTPINTIYALYITTYSTSTRDRWMCFPRRWEPGSLVLGRTRAAARVSATA